ncbi:MAG TPA: hypothetical protein VHE79_14585, partial [Spirochaetia bacterium]
QRKAIGESYWLVGKQYQTVGKGDLGRDYMNLAKIIYPRLDPASITDRELPSAAELLARGKTTPIGGEASALPTAALDSFFLRFVGALLDGNADAVMGFLDGSVYLSKVPQEVAQADAAPALASFFKEGPTAGLEPSGVYDLSSVVIARGTPSMQKAWGETYTLTVNAKVDYSQQVSFWDMTQKYYVHRTNEGWRIFALGQSAPPLSWTPQPASAAVVAAPPQAPTDAEAGTAISDTFSSTMSALLDRDVDTALASMTDNVRFLRLRQTVTKAELRTSLLGYFDKAGDQKPALQDVLDTESVFVQPTQSPVDGVTGPVYVLNVVAKSDLSDLIPFWSTYQKYYFVEQDGHWVIFAIA